MPLKSRLKVDNIYLLALSNIDDAKTKYMNFNDLWRPVVHEISQLEDRVKMNNLLTIANISYDNLGASTNLGFVGNWFTSNNICRLCLCDQEQRKKLCHEFSLTIPSCSANFFLRAGNKIM